MVSLTRSLMIYDTGNIPELEWLREHSRIGGGLKLISALGYLELSDHIILNLI